MAAFGEHAADEQAAVAVGGVFLSAEQGYAEALHAGLEPGDCCLEAGVVAEAAVEHAARGVVVGRIGGTAAQLLAKKKVVNLRLLQRLLHEFPVELRNIFRVGRTARIDHNLDLVLANKGKPCFEVVVRVAESEETAHARALG